MGTFHFFFNRVPFRRSCGKIKPMTLGIKLELFGGAKGSPDFVLLTVALFVNPLRYSLSQRVCYLI